MIESNKTNKTNETVKQTFCSEERYA
jgi:hypothetical protein